MREPTELPPILTGDEINQIQQLRDYLVRLARKADEQEPAEAAPAITETSNGIEVRDVLNAAYPVGSIYMSVASTSPAELFGGTWERITGRFLLAATDNGAEGGNSNASIKPGYTGGEASHVITTGEMAAHTHGQKSLTGTWRFRDTASGNHDMILNSWGIASHSHATAWSGTHDKQAVSSQGNNYYNDASVNATHTHDSVGSGTAHNNMPPYLAVYVWKRTA